MTRATLQKPTEPKYYQTIFERGVDPDVEDPEQCHDHSETPAEWPPLDEILDYQERVRSRARSILQDSEALQDRSIGEALWIGFEHEAMHLETFLYMLLQSEKIQPPAGIDIPDFTQMAQDAKRNAKPNKWFRIPRQTITVGLDDSDKDVVPKDSYGWDNEKPQMKINVHAFEAQARPITNGEYAKFLQASHSRAIPASWLLVDPDQAYPIAKGISRSSPGATEEYLDKFAVRTVLGSVPLELAHDWPVIASYDELANYAKWVECRIPTFEEVKSIYQFSDRLKDGTASQKLDGHRYVKNTGQMMKATNLYPSNGAKTVNAAHTPPVFRDLAGCNMGFKHWHPTAVTPNGDRLAGQGEFGGVWEWTSSPLLPQEGFEAMEIYPGYTCE